MRVYTYIFIIVGLMMLLNIAGITTTSGYVLGHLNPFSPENFTSSKFWAELVAIFTGLIGAGVALGYYLRINPESYVVSLFCSGVLILFVGDMVSIINFYKGAYPEMMWMGYMINMILFPVVVGYVISVISWWRGSD